MTSDEILELVKDGTIQPDEVEDFENLDEEVQEPPHLISRCGGKLVADGELDISEASEL